MPKIRTFVAVESSAAVRQAAAGLIEKLRPSPADVKWVEPGNMHVTLKFLGDVDPREVHEVCETVARTAAQVAPFELQFRGAGAFPNLGRPGTVWLGAGDGSAAMDALQHAIDKALKKLGFPPEGRKFHAHLTLGRVRRGGQGLKELGDLVRQQAGFDAGRMTVHEVTVFSSQLTPEGPIYQALGRGPLEGDSGE